MNIIIFFAILGVIGLISTISTLLYLFSSFGKNATLLEISEETPDVASKAFLHNVATASGGHTTHFDTDAVTTYSDNESYFKRLLADINESKRSISIVTYIWEEDSTSKLFFDALKSAVRRGVNVRLLVDSYGSSISDASLNQLREAGLKIELFRPFKPGNLSTYLARVHRRSYVFDGCVAHFGGSAISKKWFKNKLSDSFTYEDVMYRVTGEAILPIASTFGELWTATSGVIAQNEYCVAEPPKKQNAFFLSHAPRIDVHPLTYALWYACMCAKKEIFITNPYFVPGKAINDILIKKARSGVKVTVITQGSGEMWFVRASARSYYNDLLESGVEIHEHKKPHLHTKVSVFDNHMTICGSANFDIRSQRINHEFIFGVQSDDFAAVNKKVVSSYANDLEKITLEEWKKRPFWKTWYEHFLRQFSEQF